MLLVLDINGPEFFALPIPSLGKTPPDPPGLEACLNDKSFPKKKQKKNNNNNNYT
jgi:hypothetical protein